MKLVTNRVATLLDLFSGKNRNKQKMFYDDIQSSITGMEKFN